jgi:hypothetical protein
MERRSTLRGSVVAFAIAATVSCGGSTPSGLFTDGDGGGADASAAADCTQVARGLCEKAAACAGDGRAGVRTQAGGGAIVYDSVETCRTTLRDQCGPQTPPAFNPRIADPAACGRELAAATCERSALVLPTACGGGR